MNQSRSKSFSLDRITKVGILSALSYGLMFIQVPIPIAPPFMKLDLADVPSLIGGFALGPWYGVMIQFIKNLLNLSKTMTGGVGELSNFIVGSTFVLVSSLIYRNNKTKKNSILSLMLGVLAMSAVATISNAFVVFPLYGKAMNMDLSAFAAQAGKNSLVKNYFTLMIFSIAPFNIIKGAVESIVTELIYKRISPILKYS
ncbi:MAG: ECF transporter S component [Anaerococcus sp.]|uniref:ECF transporter S component n=1 Tax=Anaerococcus sp. TaxID=1872515 RepID=UPI002588CD8C|nr:ECF transporter S component [Anaerococcus sp.]MDU1828549.1 ECF transporter S component [Anaerococcus sp.]MDU1864825.1 ECF transporter S component [Anaerococcus sp.]MDU2353426.1 ECF transporter S component [Anaerococcus sp.]MDU3211004.1 ECF transporter S component [Anaerococcus sp.]